MQNKTEIAKVYRLDEHGIVRSPGKFEGEPWWVVALWDVSLDGFADREDFDGATLLVSFAIDSDLVAAIGYRPVSCDFVSLWESDNGFVNHAFTLATELDGCEGENDV